MNLPKGIEAEILAYLHLELGEDPDESSSLKLTDLKYEGVHEISGLLIHYWHYGSENVRQWATVEPFGDSYCIGMTSSTPTPLTKKDLYRYLEIESLSEPEYRKSLELEDWGEGNYGFSDFKRINIPGVDPFELLVEAQTSNTPTSVTLAINEGEREIYIRGSIGLAMSYVTKSGAVLLLSIGTGPWE